MADSTLTRRGLFASSLLLAGAAATGAKSALVAASGDPAAAAADLSGGWNFNLGRAALQAEYDRTRAAINNAPDDDDTTWARLTDDWVEAADRLFRLPSETLQQHLHKMARVVEHYQDLRCPVSSEHFHLLYSDLARLVPA